MSYTESSKNELTCLKVQKQKKKAQNIQYITTTVKFVSKANAAFYEDTDWLLKAHRRPSIL